MAHAQVSDFCGISKFLVKKLRVEDTEAYQEMIRTGYETFFEIFDRFFSHVSICHFGLSPFWAKLLTEKLIQHLPLVQTAKTYRWCFSMIVHDNLRSNARDS